MNSFQEFIMNALDIVKFFDKDSSTEAKKILNWSLDIELRWEVYLSYGICLFQLVLSVVVMLMNLYCVLAGVFLKQLHSMDFYLPLLQSVFDFLISGVLSSVYNLAGAAFYMHFACLPQCDGDPAIKGLLYSCTSAICGCSNIPHFFPIINTAYLHIMCSQ